MNKYLFLFTITNVQNFIAQARKAQDLYAGSLILSDLTGCAMQAFGKDKIIFPHNDTPMKTNRFLGICTETTDELKTLGEKIEKAVRDKIKKDAITLVTNKLNVKENELPNGFNEQIDQLLDIKWAFVRIENENYAKAHNKIEKTIAAIKNIRSAQQLNYQIENEIEKAKTIIGERGRKCSVDGERNVKFYRKNENEKDETKLLKSKLFIKNKDEVKFLENPPFSIIEQGEGLSTVSMLKRCYKDDKTDDNFPSTADICLLHLKNTNNQFKTNSKYFEGMFTEHKFLQLLINHFHKVDCGNFQDNFQTEFNSQFLFSENLTENRISNTHQLYWVNEFHKKFIQPFVGNGNRHYALLAFDIDNLGKWLAGKYLKDKTQTEKFHKTLAEKLKDFSKETEKIIPDEKGKLIYNGGDDFLALINLEYLFGIIESLQKAFSETVKFEDTIQQPTLSFGITVAHYKTPLHKVLQYTRNTLKTAKKRYANPTSCTVNEKDAIGFSVFAKNSLVAQTYFKNSDWCKLKIIVNHLKNEDLSHKFLFNFDQEFALIFAEETTFDTYTTLAQAAQWELKRLITRASSKEFKNTKPQTKLIDTVKNVLLYNVQQKATNAYTIDIENFRGFLKTAEQIVKLNN